MNKLKIILFGRNKNLRYIITKGNTTSIYKLFKDISNETLYDSHLHRFITVLPVGIIVNYIIIIY